MWNIAQVDVVYRQGEMVKISSCLVVGSDFDRAKDKAHRHIRFPAGGMICCY